MPEDQLIKDPEAFEEKHLRVEEFEVEGASFEEFLLSLGDYTDVAKAKSEKLKTMLGQFSKQITNGEAVVDKERERLQQLIDFWEGVKVNNPVSHLQSILAQADAANENKKYLEFCCKCVRRAMEIPETDLDELSELLSSKVVVSQDKTVKVLELLTSRVTNLDQDIVVKQRQRFELLEDKVKALLEHKALSDGNT